MVLLLVRDTFQESRHLLTSGETLCLLGVGGCCLVGVCTPEGPACMQAAEAVEPDSHSTVLGFHLKLLDGRNTRWEGGSH